MEQPQKDLQLFSDYMKVVDVARLEDIPADVPELYGKRLGLLNGSAWIQMWSYYFGRIYLPGVKLVNAGSEAVQLNFMRAHLDGLPCPPQSNIQVFERNAVELIELAKVDALLITCSTMNRSYGGVKAEVSKYGVPVVPIDLPMMRAAVKGGGRILVVATHGPTVDSTRELLETAATETGEKNIVTYFGTKTEKAFDCLGKGDVAGHNKCIEGAIRETMRKQVIDKVVLAQLSMSVFKLEHPDCEKEFGVPVFTSGEEGFKYMKQVLMKKV